MPQYQTHHILSSNTTTLLLLNKSSHGHRDFRAAAGNVTIELADVGYVSHDDGVFVKLFNALKGPDEPSNQYGLPSGHESCIIDNILRTTPGLPGISSDQIYESGDEMRVTTRLPHALRKTACERDVIEDKQLAEYLHENYESWVTFATEIGHNVPPSGLVFITCIGSDKQMSPISIGSGSCAEPKYTAFSPNISGSQELVDPPAAKVGPVFMVPQSILSYATSFLHDSVVALFNPTLIPWWPSNRRNILSSNYNNQCPSLFFRVCSFNMQDNLSCVQSGAGAGAGITARRGDVAQGVTFRSTLSSLGAGNGYSQSDASESEPQATRDSDGTLHTPQVAECSDSGDELAETSAAQHEGLPVEDLIGYILENSTAERALVHDNDLFSLLQDDPNEGTHDFKSRIRNMNPQIYVDEGENVGMFEYTYNSLRASSPTHSLPDMSKFIQKDSIKALSIGCGTNLDLYSATTNLADLNVVVIKVLVGTADQKAKMEQRLELEVARWQHLKHPNVAELLGTARLYPERPFGMVFKWVRNPDLLSYIGEHPEAKPDKAKEIVNGVHYLHDNGVVHGDIRVDNIIITDQGQAQISDFGIAQILDTSSFMTMTQSNIRFTAPELMPTEEVDLLTVRPTSRSDIFSLGMLLLQLFHGPDTLYRRGLPYNHISSCSGYEFGMVRRIHNGQRPLRERYNPMEDKHWNLICLCWDGEPSKRPTIAEVRQAL